MGYMLAGQLGGLGQTAYNQGAAAVGTGLLAIAPATGPAAPFVAAAGAAIQFFSRVFKFGYDPAKLNDTAVTEAFRIGMNAMWNDLTGDRLPTACEPGQCGEQRVAIFTASGYPSVAYPAGRPGVDLSQYFAALEAGYRDARSKLVRSESVAGLDQNYNYMSGLLRQVQSARAAQSPVSGFLPAGIGDLFTGSDGAVDWGVVLPLVGGAALVYAAV